MKLFITGASGVIGRRTVADSAAAAGHFSIRPCGRGPAIVGSLLRTDAMQTRELMRGSDSLKACATGLHIIAPST